MREHPSPEDITKARFEGTGYSYTLSLIQGKHKMAILYCLMEYQPVRFNQMRRYLGNVADKTLSANLKELERDGLIVRKEYPQVPPKVEYTLTDLGVLLWKYSTSCVFGAPSIDRYKIRSRTRGSHRLDAEQRRDPTPMARAKAAPTAPLPNGAIPLKIVLT